MFSIDIMIVLIVSALLSCFLFGLIALGYSLVSGVLNITNLAHGAFYMMGGYVAFALVTQIGFNPFAAYAVCAACFFLIGACFEGGTNIFKGDANRIVIFTIAVAYVLQEVAFIVWGATVRTIKPQFTIVFNLLGMGIPSQKVVISVICVLSFLIVWLFLNRTKQGKAVQMVAYNREGAMSLGIDVSRTSKLVFGISALTAALAGSLCASIYSLYPLMGWDALIIAMVIVTLGGMGSIGGTLLASFIYSIVENFSTFFLSSEWELICVFLIIIVVLLFRPQGIFGKRTERV